MKEQSALKEVRIEARVRNNVLWHAIFDLYPSVAAFCRASGISQASVNDLLNLKQSPLGKKGGFRPACRELSRLTGISCDALFPLRLYKLKQVEVSWEVSIASLEAGARPIALLSAPKTPEEELMQRELDNQIQLALGTLTPREEKVIRMHFGFEGRKMTQDQIAEEFEVTLERIRQIECKAMHKLRHPSRSNPIKRCLGRDE